MQSLCLDARKCASSLGVAHKRPSTHLSTCSFTEHPSRAARRSHRQQHGRVRQLVQHAAKNEPDGEAPSTSSRGPVVVVDNYDSFTYNLCQYLGGLGCEYIVIKNDEKSVAEVRAMNPRGVLVSPGPGKPSDSGICLQAVKELGPDIPLFGVCMGLQCIGEAFGGEIVRAPSGVMHGKTSPVYHTNVGVLEGLPNPFLAARYHSLVIKRETLPAELEITAWTEDGTIMGARHKRHPNLQGVQFHPESIITEEGKTIVSNFIKVLLD